MKKVYETPKAELIRLVIEENILGNVDIGVSEGTMPREDD